MPGLPFTQLPADITGRIIGSDGRVVEINQTGDVREGTAQTLGNLKTGQDERVFTMGEFREGPLAMPPEQPDIPDPNATLLEQSNTALKQALDAIGSKRQELEKSIQPEREAAYRDYMIDHETLAKSNMDPEHKQQRARELRAQYEKKAYGIHDKIRGDKEALAEAERQAKAEIESKRAVAEAQIKAVAGFGRKYGLSDEDIAREQFELLGIRLPQRKPAKVQTPLGQINDLRKYQAALEGVALGTRHNKKGKLEENLGTEDAPDWQVVASPERAATLEQQRNAYDAIGSEIERIASGAGQPLVGLADVARRQVAAPSRMSKRTGWLSPDGRWFPISPLAQGVKQAATKQPVGQIIERGGQQWRVVGHDADGEPLVERAS
ncbi:MAG: hypothetical protein ABFD89_12750 [Bryobacteraceae bacterium]